MVVVCDDTKTAVAYFTALKHEIKAKLTLEVVAAPCHGATPDNVIKEAINRAKALFGGTSDGEDGGDAVWVLIDLEKEIEKQEQTKKAKECGEKENIKVALSNPCYEVWTLSHLVDTGEAFHDCQAVVQRIKKEWKSRFGADFGGKKAKADYGKIIPLRSDAIKRCRKHYSHDPSWTEVYELVEYIQKLCDI